MLEFGLGYWEIWITSVDIQASNGRPWELACEGGGATWLFYMAHEYC